MRIKRTTEIYETERTRVIERSDDQSPTCPGCDGLAPMLTVEEASAAVSISPFLIHAWHEMQLLDATHANDESLLVCMNSLLWNKLMRLAQHFRTPISQLETTIETY